jgi:thiamine monophosphate kinase
VDPDRLVLSGGEDYELLFSLRKRGPSAALLSRRMGVMVTEVGRATEQPGIQGIAPELLRGGWRHF